MHKPQGQVLSFVHDDLGSRAVVDVVAGVACPRCASGKGCGAALFANAGRRVEASVPEDLIVSAGDVVEISLAPDNLLRAALIVYGIPLLGALLAAAVAYGFSLGDVAAAVAALAGLFSGLVIARRRLDRQRCLRQFIPTISKCLQTGVAPG